VSKCVSMHGEFSEHDLDGDFICKSCCGLDEDALIDDRNRLRDELVTIEADLRESIAREFDTLAGMLTDAMERTTVPIDLAICQDRRAQMATAAQMVRGGVTS